MDAALGERLGAYSNAVREFIPAYAEADDQLVSRPLKQWRRTGGATAGRADASIRRHSFFSHRKMKSVGSIDAPFVKVTDSDQPGPSMTSRRRAISSAQKSRKARTRAVLRRSGCVSSQSSPSSSGNTGLSCASPGTAAPT